MKLTTLFGIQAGLKERIGYKEKDKFSNMMLAMLVEFMECANEWQGFKYWKKNNAPKTVERIATDWDDDGNATEWDVNPNKNPLLEEYVDGLHLVLETGLDLLEGDKIIFLPKELSPNDIPLYNLCETIPEQFKDIIRSVLDLENEMDEGCDYLDSEYEALFEGYLNLGQLLGFTEEQIETAYMEKNKVNHRRQDENY
ncbi:dUTP diphosphatase [Bacillus cereus]|nr:dUTP diphosphatase [Bacillus cereus]